MTGSFGHGASGASPPAQAPSWRRSMFGIDHFPNPRCANGHKYAGRTSKRGHQVHLAEVCSRCGKPWRGDRAFLRTQHLARAILAAKKVVLLYVLTTPSGAFKIGRSAQFGTRLGVLRSSSREPLSLHASVEAPAAFEQFLHHRMRRFRLHGEWFKLSPRALRVLQAHMAEIAAARYAAKKQAEAVA